MHAWGRYREFRWLAGRGADHVLQTSSTSPASPASGCARLAVGVFTSARASSRSADVSPFVTLVIGIGHDNTADDLAALSRADAGARGRLPGDRRWSSGRSDNRRLDGSRRQPSLVCRGGERGRRGCVRYGVCLLVIIVVGCWHARDPSSGSCQLRRSWFSSRNRDRGTNPRRRS